MSKQETALPKKQSPAASRILRAVEKARSEPASATGDGSTPESQSAAASNPQEPSSAAVETVSAPASNLSAKTESAPASAAPVSPQPQANGSSAAAAVAEAEPAPVKPVQVEPEVALRSLGAQMAAGKAEPVPVGEVVTPSTKASPAQQKSPEAEKPAVAAPAAAPVAEKQAPAAVTVKKEEPVSAPAPQAKAAPAVAKPASKTEEPKVAPEQPAVAVSRKEAAPEKPSRDKEKKESRKESKETPAPVAESPKSSKETAKETNAKESKDAKNNAKPAEPARKPVNEPPVVIDHPATTSKGSVIDVPTLGMGPAPKAGVPIAAKAIIAVLFLGGGGFFAYQSYSGRSSSAAAASAAAAKKANRVFVPMSGVGGWASNWSGDPAKTNGRTISMFRPSLQQSDYRIEFEGQIEAKGFGWVFRAKDPQNYYAYRVEIVKPGLQPLVALARIVVIDGNEAQKHYALLEKPMRADTVYRIRMDSNGPEFNTWINDQLIESWHDERLTTGGIGLFTEKDDRASVRKVQILEMR